MAATAEATVAPVTVREMESWTPAQQMEALAHLARIVMARQTESLLRIPAETDTGVKKLFLAEVSEYPIWVTRKEDFTPEMRERAKYASDPRNTMPLTDELINQILDEMPD